MDRIIKNCPKLKEEQKSESPKKLFRKKGGNNTGKRFTRAELALGETLLMKKKGLKKTKKES